MGVLGGCEIHYSLPSPKFFTAKAARLKFVEIQILESFFCEAAFFRGALHGVVSHQGEFGAERFINHLHLYTSFEYTFP